MRFSEEALRRHSRTILLRAVGGRGLAAILTSRAGFLGSGESEILSSARLFASRAGLDPALEPPFDFVVAADESGTFAPRRGERYSLALAISGRSGVAIVTLPRGAAAPCARCRLEAARLAAGTACPARASLAFAAGAHLASLALAACLPSPIGNAGATLDFFPIAEPFPRSLPLSSRPGCSCALSPRAVE